MEEVKGSGVDDRSCNYSVKDNLLEEERKERGGWRWRTGEEEEAG